MGRPVVGTVKHLEPLEKQDCSKRKTLVGAAKVPTHTDWMDRQNMGYSHSATLFRL